MQIAKLILEYIRVCVWPITLLIVLAVFRRDIQQLIGRIKKASGWGVSIEAELEQAKRSSAIVEAEAQVRSGEKKGSPIPVPATELNAKLIELSFHPSPSGLKFAVYRERAQIDPVGAIGGLRLEIELALKNLAAAYHVRFSERSPVVGILQRLVHEDRITYHQHDLILRILHICNMVLHGADISQEQLDEVFSTAETLQDEYAAWLDELVHAYSQAEK